MCVAISWPKEEKGAFLDLMETSILVFLVDYISRLQARTFVDWRIIITIERSSYVQVIILLAYRVSDLI